jgi:hypothetical protein
VNLEIELRLAFSLLIDFHGLFQNHNTKILNLSFMSSGMPYIINKIINNEIWPLLKLNAAFKEPKSFKNTQKAGFLIKKP